MSDLSSLYKQTILQEAKMPYHFEKRDDIHEILQAYNPICGDKYELYVGEDQLFFHGFGCLLSKASASFMMRVLEGKSVTQRTEIIRSFLDQVRNGETAPLEILKVFENGDLYKGRMDCITLAWETMEKYIDNK